MVQDMEERLRRSLATRSQDVQPDTEMWETVRSRIRRRAYARWTAMGAVAVAALVLAGLVLPGLLTGTRVDLTPADPPDAGAVSGTGLVTTDGRTFTVSDAGGDIVRALDPPTENPEPLPIARLAVRPGSTADDLTLVYLRADDACERVEVAWTRERQPDPAKDLEFLGRAGTLGGGQGYCATDPVWSPDGRTVAWVEQEPADSGDTFALHLREWADGGDGGPGDSPSASSRHELDTPDLTALRATGWHAEESPDGGTEGVIALSGRRADGTVQAFTLPFAQGADGELELATTVEPAEPHLDAAVRSTMLAVAHGGSGPAWGYELGIDPEGTAVLSRLADDAEPLRLPLDPDVLTAGEVDGGDAWLSARGEIVVLGVAGDGWTVRVQDAAGGFAWDVPQRLPGTVVHAAPVADGRLSGEQTEEPAGDPPPLMERAPATPQPAAELPSVVTDGDAITLNRPEGAQRLVTAVSGDIMDFAVHPSSTAEDITVAWREGTGCATLHWARILEGAEAARGTPPATCPGRLAFAPDGKHLAWISQEGTEQEQGAFVLESLPWWTGPAPEVQTFTLRANPAETIALDLLDWVWTEGMEAETAGVLHLAGSDSHGTLSAYTAPIARHNDGYPGDPQLVLPDSATAEQVTPFRFDDGQERSAILRVDSHHNDGHAVGPEYTLEHRVRGDDAGEVRGDDAGELRVARGGDGDQSDEAVLPEGLLRVNTTGEVDDVWMTARGDDVLLGDGAGRAWRLSFSPDGWSAVQELQGTVRYALPFRPAEQGNGFPTS